MPACGPPAAAAPVKLASMRRPLLTALLALTLALPAWAAPSPADDEVGRLLAEKGLLDRIGQVGVGMRDRASELVVHAMGFLGAPYRRGGESVETGFDCSGFVRAIYEQTVGLVLPRQANEQAAATEVIDRKDLQPGDLVFFNTLRRAFSHVGIYVGEGKFIHAPKPGAEVRVEDMSGSYWRGRFDGARRVTAGHGASAPGGRGAAAAGAALERR
jgi:cell wall-associated NlpC family hydrolase